MDERTTHSLAALGRTIARLRAPGGCPWDRQQSHASLAPYLEEEAHEAVAAIEAGRPLALAEELGDVLVQVVMHAAVAAEQGTFDLADVAAGADAKMVRRHPHVFADTAVVDVADVLQNWDRLKAAEHGDRLSLLDGVPATLPALQLAASLQRRSARLGLDPAPDAGAARTALGAAAAALVEPPPGPDRPPSGAPAVDPEPAIAELLFAAVALARHLGVDPERALRHRAEAHRRRVAVAEAALRATGRSPTLASPAEWRAAFAAAGPDGATPPPDPPA